MLVLFRSQPPGQSWVTALGLIADSALHVELIEGEKGRPAYWTLRRSIKLMDNLTRHVDLTEYRERIDAGYEESQHLFDDLYDTLSEHGFEMAERDVALERTRELRRRFDAQLEYLIDALEAPRGFWGHQIGDKLDLSPARRSTSVEEERPT